MESRIERKKKNQYMEERRKRIIFIGSISTFLLLALIGRLYYIQMVKGDEYYAAAKKQWTKEIPIGISRGKIYDRNQNLLTNRHKKEYLMVFPKYFVASNPNIEILKKISGNKANVLKDKKILRYEPIKLEIINHNKEFIDQAVHMKGVFPIEYTDRYEKIGLAAHVIGYINTIDNRGEKGIEKVYDEILKENQVSKVAAIVDAQKRRIPGLKYEMINGSSTQKNVVTTLDYKIQKLVEEELDKLNKKGSVVVLDSKNGEVLAMASRPNFKQDQVAKYLKSTKQELYNRAVQIAYPPGSIFKIIVAAAFLEENIKEDTFFCKGYEEIDGVQIKCSSFKKGGHGEIHLEDAFAQSCNTAFIQMGQRIGGEKIIDMAKKFGLGAKTEVGLAEEIEGKIPTKDHIKGAGIGNLSIGQGTLEVTPIQMAKMTNIIANGGVDQGISLIQGISNENGDIIKKIEKKPIQRVIAYETAQRIQRMMEKVIEVGTAKRVKLYEIGHVAGKTGSSESSDGGKKVVHAWFTGYFPSHDPKYTITVMIEDGKSGGKVAAPLFKKILEGILQIK
ncbi:peptidoglycan D,D-transpeptidase FtsI family protein [Inediibacterium massiliense]|uniref:peptidoglycan D,D-transpeptidase FtsI family protein n=1 Tax=Inediibacterium massiliense TaxID=1658111 RepID=UPI0006B697EB|nr:penicillin-binding protein 2 [Inediibacterium massiliense]